MKGAKNEPFHSLMIEIRHSISTGKTLRITVLDAYSRYRSKWMERHRFTPDEMDEEMDDKIRPMVLCIEHLEEAARYLEIAEHNMCRME